MHILSTISYKIICAVSFELRQSTNIEYNKVLSIDYHIFIIKATACYFNLSGQSLDKNIITKMCYYRANH